MGIRFYRFSVNASLTAKLKNGYFYRSEILAIGIRPKQLMSIAQKLSQKLNTQIDFYTLVSCKTIQDVVNKVEQQIK